MSWLYQLMRRPAPEPQIQPPLGICLPVSDVPEKPSFDYFAKTPTYSWLDTIQDSEMGLALAIRHFQRNSGGEHLVDWPTAIADLERRGLTTNPTLHKEIITQISGIYDDWKSILVREQAATGGDVEGASQAVASIRDCLRHLILLLPDSNIVLELAIRFSDKDMVQTALDRGADPNAKIEGRPILFRLLSWPDGLRLFLHANADVQATAWNGVSPVQFLVEDYLESNDERQQLQGQAKSECLRILVEAGADTRLPRCRCPKIFGQVLAEVEEEGLDLNTATAPAPSRRPGRL